MHNCIPAPDNGNRVELGEAVRPAWWSVRKQNWLGEAKRYMRDERCKADRQHGYPFIKRDGGGLVAKVHGTVRGDGDVLGGVTGEHQSSRYC